MRNNRTTTTRFWILSAIFHLLAFVVFFLTPAGQRVFEPRDRSAKPDIVRKDEELADVVDDIRALAMGRLRDQVQIIEGVSGRMEHGVETAARSYREFQSRQMASAEQRFLEAATAILDLQKTLLEEIRAFTESETPDAGELNDVFTAHRGDIEAGLEEIHRILQLGAADNPEPREWLERIEKDQFSVFVLIPELTKDRGREVRALKEMADLKAEKAELEPQVDANVEGLESYRARIDPAKEDRISKMMTRRRSEARVKKLEEALRKKEVADEDTEGTLASLKEAREQLEEDRKIFTEATDLYESVRSTAIEFRKNVERQEKRLPYIAERLPKLENAVPRYRSDYQSKSASALELQETVVENQQKLNTMILGLLKENPAVPGSDESERGGDL